MRKKSIIIVAIILGITGVTLITVDRLRESEPLVNFEEVDFDKTKNIIEEDGRDVYAGEKVIEYNEQLKNIDVGDYILNIDSLTLSRSSIDCKYTITKKEGTFLDEEWITFQLDITPLNSSYYDPVEGDTSIYELSENRKSASRYIKLNMPRQELPYLDIKIEYTQWQPNEQAFKRMIPGTYRVLADSSTYVDKEIEMEGDRFYFDKFEDYRPQGSKYKRLKFYVKGDEGDSIGHQEDLMRKYSIVIELGNGLNNSILLSGAETIEDLYNFGERGEVSTFELDTNELFSDTKMVYKYEFIVNMENEKVRNAPIKLKLRNNETGEIELIGEFNG